MEKNTNQDFFLQPDYQEMLNSQNSIKNSENHQKFFAQNFLQHNSYISFSSSKFNTQNKKNHNQQLQDLLQTETVNYGNLSNLSGEKRKLFPDLSFISKDYTHDQSTHQGYVELMNKIHFQRSRNRELNHQLALQKQQLIQKYLNELTQQFNELSNENKRLRDIYKKQAGGGYRQKLQKNFWKMTDLQNNDTFSQYNCDLQTPRNGTITNRRAIYQESLFSNKYNAFQTNGKEKPFRGLGNDNFSQTQKVENIIRQSKMQYCESSIDINSNQSLVPSPKRHKRRQSQMTERKDYMSKQNISGEFLMIMDDKGGQLPLDNQSNDRMPSRKIVPKLKFPKQLVNHQTVLNDSSYLIKANCQLSNKKLQSIKKNSCQQSVCPNDQSICSQNRRNIFIDFLQVLLIDERISYVQLTEDIKQTTCEGQDKFMVPSYNNNFKPIQQIQKQIIMKNLKLKQLQQVINAFKFQIEQIIGIDIKIIDQSMNQLIQIKGKYLQMQEKVNGITGLKKTLQNKSKLKQDILNDIKQKIEKHHKDQKKYLIFKSEETVGLFSIPQSIKALFKLLNLQMPLHAKPIDYLNLIKQLPKNKQLFQVFESKKKAACSTKFKQVIDQIRQGRKKFNQLIKIYELRIVKLQQKLQKYKLQKQTQDCQKK